MPPPVEPLPAYLRTYEQPKRVVIAYFSLELFAFLSLVPLLWTFLSRRVKRDATISNLVAVFMAVSIGTSVLFLSGTLIGPKEDVRFGVCLASASIAYGTSPAQSLAALNIVLRITIRIVASQGRWTTFCDSKSLAIYLLVSPWAVWIIFIASAISIGLEDRKKVFQAVLYCGIDDSTFIKGFSIFTAITTLLTIILEILIATILCRQFLALRSIRKASEISNEIQDQPSSSGPFTLGGASLPLILRLGLFGLCVILALIFSIVSQGDFSSLAGDWSNAGISCMVVFIFGSQEDVLKAWHLKSRSTSHASPSVPAFVSNASRGMIAPTETYVMDSTMDRARGREADLESNESGDGLGRWGSQVALRESKGGSGRSGSGYRAKF